MALIDQIFGSIVYDLSLDEVKRLIRSLKMANLENKKYLLKEWSKFKNYRLSNQDFRDLE